MTEIQGNVIEYLESLPNSTLHSIYKSPSSCLAILKLLPELSKQIIYRLLYISQPIDYKLIQGWLVDPKKLDLKQLTKLQILKFEEQKVFMNSNYQLGLHDALTGVCEQASFGRPCETLDKNSVTCSFLDQYALNSWENVLHYLVGTSQDKRAPAVVQLLEKSGLMTQVSGEMRITSKGFQFLLQEMKVQVWALLLQYLELSTSLQMEPVQVLHFLFQLGSLEFGQDYSVDTLTPTQKHMLSDLKCLGLVYQRNKKSSRFYPTRMATLLASGQGEYALADVMESNATTTALEKKGFIILETNFKVYAYTNSHLQIAILSLFISMQTRFPNMVVGMITRDSIREALTRGITADQIVSFLTTHAHPEMRSLTPILPSTVVDQIRLWEMERNRLRHSKGTLYQGFTREQDYRDVCKQADDYGYVLWRSDHQKMVVLSMDGHEHIRTWLREKANQAKA